MGSDSILKLHEELKALESSVQDCNDEVASLLEKNASLEAKNALLEERNRLTDERISKIESFVAQQEDALASVENAPSEEDDDLVPMNQNSYALLYTSTVCSRPFVVGLAPVFMQFSVFWLFLLDLLSNSTIPPDVTTLVRACQIIAIVITFLINTDMLRALRSLIFREGFEEMKHQFEGFSIAKFYAANILMAVQGLLGTVVAFFLIIFADNVFDLLLNFTAVMFVSELDEFVYFFANTGYAGKESESLTKKIEAAKLKSQTPNGVLKYLHLALFGSAMIAVFAVFGTIAASQDSQEGLVEFVKVEFGDDADPTMGLFVGCYKKQLPFGLDERVRYVQTQSDRGPGVFEYCSDDGLQTWVFTADTSERDGCDGNYALRSSEERSSSFDLLDAKRDQWVLDTGNPISTFQLGEVDPIRFEAECGKIQVQESTADEELCPVLTIDADAIGMFSRTNDWSRTFELLENPNSNEPVQFFQRPVFVGESPGMNGYDLLFFAGRRWVLASASNLLTEGDPSSKMDVISLFEMSEFWLLNLPVDSLSFLSEAVSQGNDQGTPLGLQWYSALYEKGFKFPYADASRPLDAAFRCGQCNSRTNPCLFGGTCEEDGHCTCAHGASGELCEIKPLGDGVCNPFFNTEPNEYDGGDCCVGSCSSIDCGIGSLKYAFDQTLQREGIGFPDCKDPSMVPVTIVLQSDMPELPSFVNFESYTVEVLCDEGETVPLRLGLDPTINGTLSETLYLSDNSGSCVLSFIGIQSLSALDISFEVFDGSDSSSDSMLLMSKEENITSDAEFVLPPAYSRCLKSTLASAIEQKHLYTGSYQDEAFAWLSHDVSRKGGDCSNAEYLTERYALLALSTAEEAPKRWPSAIDHCFWPRVTCHGSKVVEITYDGLANGALRGVWAPEFSLLRNLERIDIFGNEFSQGSIPTGIFNLTALATIGLVGNGLTGTIPSEIGNLSLLTKLNAYINNLSGTIPSEVGNLSALVYFDVETNVLTGTIPSEVGNLSELATLNLHMNMLSGAIPSEVGNLSSLEYLGLASNALSGMIPSEVGNLNGLTALYLQRNKLAGTIPSEVGTLTSLVYLDLGFNSLSGTVPTEVGTLSALTALDVHNNALSGTIPTEIGLLSGLMYLNFENIDLTGTLPSEISLLTDIRVLVLGGNKLSGLLTEVLKLTNLRELDLSGNLFSEDEVNSAMEALGLVFSCDETTVEMELITDLFPDETTWEITTANGTVVASGSDYFIASYTHHEKACVPLDACTFTLFDQYQDGGPSLEITRLGKVYQIDGAFTDKVIVDICE